MPKLSELIRQGAAQHPQQAFAEYCYSNDRGQIIATCALGAACCAAGLQQLIAAEDINDMEIFQQLGQAAGVDIYAPIGATRTPLWLAIVTKNDNGETRESIAAWLEERGL